jgi:ABC transporter substrate binding protein
MCYLHDSGELVLLAPEHRQLRSRAGTKFVNKPLDENIPAQEINRTRVRHAVDARNSRKERLFGEVSGLLSYAPSFDDLFRRAATYVDRILKGAKPADLPVEQPTEFELVISPKSAKALELTIPQSLQLQAELI